MPNNTQPKVNDLVSTTRDLKWRNGLPTPAGKVGLVLIAGPRVCRVAFANYTRMVPTNALELVMQRQKER
jgi:hypothetical protein